MNEGKKKQCKDKRKIGWNERKKLNVVTSWKIFDKQCYKLKSRSKTREMVFSQVLNLYDVDSYTNISIKVCKDKATRKTSVYV